MTATILQFPERRASFPQPSVMAFVRSRAAGYKPWEKVWVLLDGTGSPVKLLTPGEAGAAARVGRATTWVKNLWWHSA